MTEPTRSESAPELTSGAAWLVDLAERAARIDLDGVVQGHLRPGIVRAVTLPRQRLIDQLLDPPMRRVAVVTGPAGSGKTTLLCQWVARSPQAQRVGWLSLQPSHNAPREFWTGFAAAVATAASAKPSDLFRGDDLDLIRRGDAVRLLTVLDRLDEPLLVVLDDYHVVSDRTIHRTLSTLIELSPAHARFAIGSRSRPTLRLSRLESTGQLVEIDPTLLAFSEDEVGAFARNRLGNVPDPVTASLHQASRGWPAIVALAVQASADVSALRRRVNTGLMKSREIAAYLLEELLLAQTEELRSFVVETAHLGELNASLCDAVRARDDSIVWIEQLDRLELLMRMEDQCTWRYHELIGEVLQRAARVELGGEFRTYATRAITWFAEQGRFSDAAEHARRADEHVLLVGHGLAAIRELQAPVTDVIVWFDALPDSSLIANPDLLNLMSIYVTTHGDCERADRLVALVSSAAELADGDPSKNGQLTEFFGATVFGADFALACEALDQLTDSNVPELWRRFLPGFRVFALHGAGDTVGAAALAENYLIDPPGPLFRRSMAGLSAAMRVHLDDIEGAQAILRTCPGNVDDVLVDFSVDWAKSMLAAKAGDAEVALALFERAAAWTGTSGWPRAVMSVERTELQLALGSADGARSAFEELVRTLATVTTPGHLAERTTELSEILGVRDPLADPQAIAAGQLGLSEREIEVLLALDQDASLPVVAEDLYISRNTLKTHTRSIYRKLGVSSRHEARALLQSWADHPPGDDR